MTTNNYYSYNSGQPIQRSRGSSQAMRAEFEAIAAAFTKVEEAVGINAALGDLVKVYQGSAANDPTQRRDGTRLEDGDLYFNTVSKVMKSFGSGTWHALPTSESVMTKEGGAFRGPIKGTSAEFSGQVKAASFAGVGAALTGFKLEQITNGLGYTPVNRAGDTLTGTLNGTNITLSGVLAAQTVRQTSDERKKQKWQPPGPDFVDELAAITKRGSFTWKKGKTRDLGVSAQQVGQVMPEAVCAAENGDLALSYGPAALVAAIELARAVVELRDELEQLKAKLEA